MILLNLYSYKWEIYKKKIQIKLSLKANKISEKALLDKKESKALNNFKANKINMKKIWDKEKVVKTSFKMYKRI